MVEVLSVFTEETNARANLLGNGCRGTQVMELLKNGNLFLHNFFSSDIDECLTSPCSTIGFCTNTPGSFSCQCSVGYTGNGFSCSGIYNYTELQHCIYNMRYDQV